jgi:hypothetical protein
VSRQGEEKFFLFLSGHSSHRRFLRRETPGWSSRSHYLVHVQCVGGAGLAQSVQRMGSYGLGEQGPKDLVSSPSRPDRPALGPTQNPVTMGTGAVSPLVTRQGREANHYPLSSAKMKDAGPIPPLSHNVFTA